MHLMRYLSKLLSRKTRTAREVNLYLLPLFKVAMAVLDRDRHALCTATKYCHLPSQPFPNHPNTDEDRPLSGNCARLAGLAQCSAQDLQGCLLEDRCLQTVEAMCNLLAILTPTAMRLLWLRETAQTAPDTPATEVISEEVLQVVLHLNKRPKATLTARELWRTIARSRPQK